MRRGRKLVLVLALFVALLCVPLYQGNAFAQESKQKLPVATALPPEDRKVDVPAEKATPLKDILGYIQDQLGPGVNITAAKELEEVTIEKKVLIGVGWKKALEDIAESVGGQLTYPSDNWVKIVSMPKVTISMQEVDLPLILKELAVLSGKNIVVGPEVKGKVSVTLKNVSWKTAFHTIVKTMGFVAVEEAEDILRVTTKEKLEAQLETEIFTLKYLRPQDPYMAVLPVGEGTEKEAGRTRERFVKSGAIVSKGRGIEEFTALKVLRNALSPEIGKLEYNWDTNQIIVTDVKPKLEEIRRLIKQLDIIPPQVSIDVKFIRTTSSDLFEKGIRFMNPDVSKEEGATISSYFPTPATRADVNRMGMYEGTYRFDLGQWESIRRGFGAVGVLDFTQTQIMLRLLKYDTNSRIIQAPSILAMDNQEAIIFVGESVPFVKQQANVDQSGNVTVTITEDESSPISVGFTLFIVPHVIHETGEIALTVIPKTNTLIGTFPDRPGFERFEAKLAGGVTTYLDLPRTLDQTIVTKMLVKDSSTAVVGGLLTERKLEKENKIPFFASLPIIGHIFRWKRDETVVENLIIFISPRVITTSEEHLAAAEDQIRTMKNADYFYKKYNLNAAAQLEEKLSQERAKIEAARAAAQKIEEEKEKEEQEPKKEEPEVEEPGK
jgi:type II secretory pathway component GspD/PulD (secretin)